MSRSQYNRILIERVPSAFYRPYVTGQSIIAVPDVKCLRFLLEEFIALSAARMVIPAHSDIAASQEFLSPKLKRRVIWIDKFHMDRSWNAFFNLLREEYGVTIQAVDYPGEFAMQFRDGTGREVTEAVATIIIELSRFARAMSHELQCELDLTACKDSLNFLRRESKNDDLRLILASVSGLLGTYEEQTVPSLAVRATDYDMNLADFRRLLDDELYKSMSRQAHELGNLGRFDKARRAMEECGRRLVTRSPYKEILDFGSKIITAATGIPLPESAWVKSLLGKRFLPPIVKYDLAIQLAHEAWKSSTHEPAGPKGFGPWGFTDDAEAWATITDQGH